MELICVKFWLSSTQCHRKIHPLAFDTQHAECVTMSLQLFNTALFLFYHSQTQTTLILTLPTFCFLFCSISHIVTKWMTPPPQHTHKLLHTHTQTHNQLFTIISILTGSAVSCPRGKMEHSKPLHLRGNSEKPCPRWSICHHVECQVVSLGLTSGHCSPWHTERGKECNREGKTDGEQRENEPDKGPETDTSHSAEPGETAARLSAPLISQMQPSDNVTLITESPDSDFPHLCKQCQLKQHIHTRTDTHTPDLSSLFPSKNA